MRIVNNPIDMVLQAVNELYPEAKALIQFNPELDLNECCGATTYPDNENELPLIDISSEIPFSAVIEILAHEIAHVVAGKEAEHGEKWEEVFNNIYNKYEEIGNQMFGEE